MLIHTETFFLNGGIIELGTVQELVRWVGAEGILYTIPYHTSLVAGVMSSK